MQNSDNIHRPRAAGLSIPIMPVSHSMQLVESRSLHQDTPIKQLRRPATSTPSPITMKNTYTEPLLFPNRTGLTHQQPIFHNTYQAPPLFANPKVQPPASYRQISLQPELKAENEKLKQKLNQFMKLLSEEKDKTMSLIKTNSQLYKELGNFKYMKDEIQILKKQNRELFEENKSLKEEIKFLTQERQSYERRYAEADRAVRDRDQEISSYKWLLDKLRGYQGKEDASTDINKQAFSSGRQSRLENNLTHQSINLQEGPSSEEKKRSSSTAAGRPGSLVNVRQSDLMSHSFTNQSKGQLVVKKKHDSIVNHHYQSGSMDSSRVQGLWNKGLKNYSQVALRQRGLGRNN